MQIRTNLKAGGVITEAQSQAEKVFDSLNQTLSDAADKVGQAASTAGRKLSNAWTCFLTS